MSAATLQRRPAVRLAAGTCPVIETARLILRPHRLTDAEAIAQSFADFEVTRMLARVPVPYDRQDAVDWLMPRLSGLMPDWALAITTGDDVHIGMVGLELRHGRWHLGYWLNRYYWGRGFMSEAVAAAVERWSRRLPQTVLFSGVFIDNPASLKIQEKLGFRITGVSEIFSTSRNAMVRHLETELLPQDFRQQPGR